MLTLALSGLARPAAASKGIYDLESAPACQPLTARQESEILTPLRSPDAPELPERGLILQLGENLCVGAAGRTADGSLEPIELVQTGDDMPVLLHLSLARLPDGSSALSVQNDTKDAIILQAMTPFGASPLFAGGRYLRAPARERTLFSWERPLERVALFGFQVEPERARPDHYEHEQLRGQRRVERDGSVAGIGLVGYFGVMPLRLDALSQELAKNGYASAPTNQALGGAAFWFSFWRLRLDLYIYGGSNTFKNHTTDDQLSLNLTSGGISLGWEVLRHRSLALYPYAGISRSALSFDALTRYPPPLPSLRPSPDPRRGVTTGGAQLDLGVAFDQVVVPLVQPRSGYLGVTVGMKVGYNVPLSRPGWSAASEQGADEVDYQGGPRIDLGGPYVLFTAGFALRSVDF